MDVPEVVPPVYGEGPNPGPTGQKDEWVRYGARRGKARHRKGEVKGNRFRIEDK